jgi:hypothetical protein
MVQTIFHPNPFHFSPAFRILATATPSSVSQTWERVIETMTPSNFSFLEPEFPLLFNLGQAAEFNLYGDWGKGDLPEMRFWVK